MSKIVVVGPCATSGTFCWNTAPIGDQRGALQEQAFLGSYHAVPGPFPEAYAARCAAAWNQDPIVEVYAADRWQIGALRRRLQVPQQWLGSATEKQAWELVCAEAARVVLLYSDRGSVFDNPASQPLRYGP